MGAYSGCQMSARFPCKPVLPEVVGDVAAGIERFGIADGTFTYKMRVEFGLPQIAAIDTKEPDDTDS